MAAKSSESEAEHAVLIRFSYGSTDLTDLFSCIDELEAIIDETNSGEVDGHDIAKDGSDGTIYLYGPDADQLFGYIREALANIRFMKGAVVTLRYGPPEDGVKERSIKLDT